jgi:outer membrane protein TolC
LKDADAAFTLGAITKADLLRLRALVANSELLVSDAATGLEISRRQLAITMGDPRPRDYRVGESLSAEPNAVGDPGSLDAALSDGLSRRLESQALSEASRASRRGARATAGGAYPRLEAFGDVLYANPNQRFFPQRSEWHATWGVGLQAIWTVGDTFSNSAAAAELDARARSLDAQRAALRDGIRQEVTAAFLLSRKARLSLETSRRALEAAQEAYRVATDLYRVGRSTTTELIEAESDLLNARLAELDARIELRVSDERLRHATGRDARR